MFLRSRWWCDGRTVFVLMLVALGIRLFTQNWDAGLPPSPHPDERRVVMVAEGLDGWFDDPEFYAYGSLHFQAVRLVNLLMGQAPTWSDLMRAGRMMSLLASMAGLLLGWWLAREAWGRKTGTVFLLLAIWLPIDQQLSHYATVEAHHSFWVLLALAAAFQLARRPTAVWAAAAGAAVGASLAVKVSSLGLLVPAAVALALVAIRWGTVRILRLAGTGLFSALCAFWIGQPWAYDGARPPWHAAALAAIAAIVAFFGGKLTGRWAKCVFIGAGMILAIACLISLAPFTTEGSAFGGPLSGFSDSANPDFVEGVQQQIAMVTGVADVPYVRVYAATVPFFYPLRELSLWALGPALVGCFLWGLGRVLLALRRRFWKFLGGWWSPSWALLLIVVAWTVPMALRLSTLEVKFLRYWGPLVLPMVLIASWSLARLRRSTARWALPLVVGLGVLWGGAYLWAFADPHPFGTAARWLGMVHEDGAVIAWEHWDESLPWMNSPRVTLESYNLPDDEHKVRAWVEQLESAQWVVLTSNRVRRTVLANPGRFPHTGRLYRLLLGGEAGFEVVSTASRGPRVAGLFFPVQRADESFVNYEFPRVTLLRRVRDVDREALVRQALGPHHELDNLSLASLEKRFLDPAPHIPRPPGALRQWADGMAWVGVFAVCGFIAWLLFVPVLAAWPDAGLGLSFVTGWFGSAWLLWLGTRVTGVPVGPASAAFVLLFLFCAAGFAAFRFRRTVRRAWLTRRRGMVHVVVFAAGVFLLFLLVRAYNPAVFWGEKPMDFSFFNAFVAAPSWPPGEPWMAGEPLHYYYFGEVLAAFPTLLSGADQGVAYNLMCASVPALAAAALAGLAMLVGGRRRRIPSLILPVSVLLVGNLAWPWLLGLAKQGRWFDLWWATSRVVPGYAIDEFPLWTALFADLHAHFIALPVLVAALMWVLVLVSATGKKWWAAALMCGVSVGILAATNPWDVLLFAAACAGGLLVTARRGTALQRLAVAAVISLVSVAPFLLEMRAWLGGGGIGGRPLLFLTQHDFAPWWAILRHFGLFLLPLLVAALTPKPRRLGILLCLAVVASGLGLAFGSTAAALALGLVVVFVSAALRAGDRWQVIAWVLATCGAAGIAFAERFTLLDRMNTVFKIYNGVWLFLAVAMSILILRAVGSRRRTMMVVVCPLLVIAAVNLPLGIAQGWLQPRIRSPRPTLDGRAYLAADRQDSFLIEVVRGSARPGDVIAEAAGPSYGRFTRIAMNTGQPTVVAWDWHLQQRGQDRAAIMSRFEDLYELYAGDDPIARRAVLDRYQVDWTVVGDLERETYNLRSDDPLAGIPGVKKWAEKDGALVYRVIPTP